MFKIGYHIPLLVINYYNHVEPWPMFTIINYHFRNIASCLDILTSSDRDVNSVLVNCVVNFIFVFVVVDLILFCSLL